jgi:hypothetical protein
MKLKERLFGEFKTYWANVLYITLFFTIFTSYKRLILAHYQIVYGEYGISLIKALVLAKIILIAEHLHLGRGLENKPLAYPTLYKSFLFTVCVAIVNVIEFMIRGFIKAKGFEGVADILMGHFSYEWVAWMLATFVIFIPFFAMRELRRVLGKGKVSELFFKKSSGAKLSGSE